MLGLLLQFLLQPAAFAEGKDPLGKTVQAGIEIYVGCHRRKATIFTLR